MEVEGRSEELKVRCNNQWKVDYPTGVSGRRRIQNVKTRIPASHAQPNREQREGSGIPEKELNHKSPMFLCL